MRSRPRAPSGEPREAIVRPIPFSAEDDRALVRGVCARHPGAQAALYDRFAPRVERVLVRLLGFDDEIPDLLQDVFMHAFENIHSLKDPSRLRAWITSITVFSARGVIRRRRRRAWLRLVQPAELLEVAGEDVDRAASDAARHTYAILDRLPANERIAFALRFVEEMELTDVAAACDVSLATIKRRIARARTRFMAMAQASPALRSWVEASPPPSDGGAL